MISEIIVDFEFYENGEVVSWLQTSLNLEVVETEDENPPSIYDSIMEWVEENYPGSVARITNIWTV